MTRRAEEELTVHAEADLDAFSQEMSQLSIVKEVPRASLNAAFLHLEQYIPNVASCQTERDVRDALFAYFAEHHLTFLYSKGDDYHLMKGVSWMPEHSEWGFSSIYAERTFWPRMDFLFFNKTHYLIVELKRCYWNAQTKKYQYEIKRKWASDELWKSFGADENATYVTRTNRDDYDELKSATLRQLKTYCRYLKRLVDRQIDVKARYVIAVVQPDSYEFDEEGELVAATSHETTLDVSGLKKFARKL